MISSAAWVVFAGLCAVIAVSLLADVIRQKLRERRAIDECPPTLRCPEYAAAQMARRCAHRLSCYCRCAPNCALYAPKPGLGPADKTALIRRPKRLACIGG